MKIILLGSPGAGKGTLAGEVQKLLHVPHISTGDLFREHVQKGTPIGKEVKRIMEGGDLVPDELTIRMVQDRLTQEDAKTGFLFDGFPRTVPQAEALSKITDIDYVLHLLCPREILVRRLTSRRYCPSCGRIYNVISKPPKVDNVCDADGTPLQIRKDDNPESVETRLKIYNESTAPLIQWYEDRGLLREVDASESPDKGLQFIRSTLSTSI